MFTGHIGASDELRTYSVPLKPRPYRQGVGLRPTQRWLLPGPDTPGQVARKQQLLSLDACMECGRCEEVCPAFATEKPLSPKRVVQDLKVAMEKTATALTAGKEADVPPLHGVTIAPETLWSCTACSACVNTCPVRIDQLNFILTMRRHLVAEGALSGTAAVALRRMQSNANPWGLPPGERTNWTDALKPKS